jgi:hypothetical protein
MSIRYEVKITGHAAPFKWEVARVQEVAGGTGTGRTLLRPVGEADTYEDALFDAAAFAQQSEWDRWHGATVRTETLFEVDDEEPMTGITLGLYGA